ncbi:MAG TPA: FAD binding domain-containing protein, partial [Acetobacteraceae bacterium]|nr:FAD binding domain-containing protein [Acetobacteraceae bacterium]
MQPFGYAAATTLADALAWRARVPDAMLIAGGTDMLQLLRESVIAPAALIDIGGLDLHGVGEHEGGVRIGAAAKLADVADDRTIRARYPVLAQALAETASPQVRNRATVGGNLLQRTRCLYFRDVASPCNRRIPGSGCPAQEGENRINAILGGSAACSATYPSDMATALVALDAEIMLQSSDGARRMAVADLHCAPGDAPEVETNLRPGEIIEA